MSAYQLVFKIINITSRTDGKICTLAICASTIKCCSIDLTHIIDVYSIPIFDSEGSICAVCRCFFCNFRCSCCVCCFGYLWCLGSICCFSDLRCLSSFLCCFFCGLRCCCCYGIFVVILDLKSLEDFLVYSDICIFQPFVCGFCIQIILSCADDGFFFVFGCCFIIFLIQSYYIVSRVCLDHIRSYFSIIQGSQNIQYFIRIRRRGRCIFIFVIRILYVCVKRTSQCAVRIVYRLGCFAHICCRIFGHCIQDLLSIFFLCLDLIITEVRSADTYICERRLLCFFIRNIGIYICYNRIMNTLFVCFQFQVSLYLVFCYSQIFQCIFCIG